ncbi:ferredoxin-NADPH reductase [Cellulomonas humilata]|uniref:Membrane protein YesL n=1 Tax=Cellulomonas humilata TaxID=144055 RepID=A0ABU0EIU1_9CELL|nr:ferredoxin-NADPH reductase [Cellulomonas humilata]MDQ0375194.1 putative membrane protein YesL [Cellulomonas humilata]
MSTLSVTTYERGFRGLWIGLVVNLLLAVACAPLLLALVLVEDPLAALPFFAVLSCVCGPALMGAFGAFAADDRPAAAFVAAYRRGFLQGLLLWAGGAAVLGVLAVNTVGALSGDVAFARPLLPMFVVLAALVVAVGSFSLVAVGHRPGVPFGELLRESAALAVRRWYLSALNVVVLAVLVAVLLVKPGIGVLIACAPLLYVVWSNAGYALTPQEDR